jgi:transposase
MASGYSRWLCAKTIPTRNAADLVLGQWAVIGQLGAVPATLVWDNESGVGRYGGGNPKLTAEFNVLRGMLGCRVQILRPRDPESKGMVERANGFLETSFLPGRSFVSVAQRRTVGCGLSGRYRRVGTTRPPTPQRPLPTPDRTRPLPLPPPGPDRPTLKPLPSSSSPVKFGDPL